MASPGGSPGSSLGFGVGGNVTASSFDMMLGKLFLNVTVAADWTLPTAFEEVDCELFNVGSEILTVKLPSTSTLVSIDAGDYARVLTYLDASGVPQWSATTPIAY